MSDELAGCAPGIGTARCRAFHPLYQAGCKRLFLAAIEWFQDIERPMHANHIGEPDPAMMIECLCFNICVFQNVELVLRDDGRERLHDGSGIEHGAQRTHLPTDYR